MKDKLRARLAWGWIPTLRSIHVSEIVTKVLTATRPHG